MVVAGWKFSRQTKDQVNFFRIIIILRQTPANHGPDKANTKVMWPKPSRSRFIKLMDRGQVKLNIEANIEANIEVESAIFEL